MSDKKTLAALSLLVGVETLGTFGNFVPPIVDVTQRAAKEPDFCQGLRRTYLQAGLTTLGLAGIVAYLAESAWPLAAWAVGSGAAIVNYEHALPMRARILGQFVQGSNVPPYKLVSGHDDATDDSSGWKGKHYPLRLPI